MRVIQCTKNVLTTSLDLLTLVNVNLSLFVHKNLLDSHYFCVISEMNYVKLEINGKSITCNLQKLKNCCSYFNSISNHSKHLIFDHPNISPNLDFNLLRCIINGGYYEITGNTIKDIAVLARSWNIYDLNDLEGYWNTGYYDIIEAMKKCQEYITYCNDYNFDETIERLKDFVMHISCREMVKIIFWDLICKKSRTYEMMEWLLIRLETVTNLYFKHEFINNAKKQTKKALNNSFHYQENLQEKCYLFRKIIDSPYMNYKCVSSDYDFLCYHPMFTDIVPQYHKFVHFYEYSEYKNYLSQNSSSNFQQHREILEKGNNPRQICEKIRNDQANDIVTRFDVNMKIGKSVYEACSLVNTNVPLISYAVFYGAIEFVNFFFHENAIIPDNIFIFACASGDNEIVELLENYRSDMKRALETTIIYHKQNVMEYIYEKYIDEYNTLISDYTYLVDLCIYHCNYEALYYFMQKLDLNTSLLVASAKNENSPLAIWSLTQWCFNRNELLNKKYQKYSPLGYAAKKFNSKLLKKLLDEPGIDCNQCCDDEDVYFYIFGCTPFLLCCKYYYKNRKEKYQCLHSFIQKNINLYQQTRFKFYHYLFK